MAERIQRQTKRNKDLFPAPSFSKNAPGQVVIGQELCVTREPLEESPACYFKDKQPDCRRSETPGIECSSQAAHTHVDQMWS